MAKTANIASMAEKIITPCVEKLGYRIWDVEFVKEGAGWYLRITIDSDDGIDIDDCEKVSRAISPLLDEADPIEQNYTLEVSSPGLTRPLKKENDFKRSIGKIVEIKTYTKIDNCKDFEGELTAYDEETVTILTEDEKELKIARKDISMIRLAFVY